MDKNIFPVLGTPSAGKVLNLLKLVGASHPQGARLTDLIVQSARARHESRGLHFSRDYPEMLDEALPTILVPGQRV